MSLDDKMFIPGCHFCAQLSRALSGRALIDVQEPSNALDACCKALLTKNPELEIDRLVTCADTRVVIACKLPPLE